MEKTETKITLHQCWDAATETAARYLWYPLIVFLTHLIASQVFKVYQRFPPLDIPMHLIGGFVIAFFISGSAAVFQRHGIIQISNLLLRATLIFALTCTAAVFWEFLEYISDHTIGTHSQTNLEDTLLDMLLGITGGVVFILILSLRREKKLLT